MCVVFVVCCVVVVCSCVGGYVLFVCVVGVG